MFVLIFCDFCGFISRPIAYTTLNKLRAVFVIYNVHYSCRKFVINRLKIALQFLDFGTA